MNVTSRRRRGRIWVAVLAAGASSAPLTSTLAACGHADQAIPPANVDKADDLFKEARRLMGEKKIEEACAKFAESQCLDPAPGTLLNLGACHAKQKKFGAAWIELSEAKTISERDGNAAREDLARQELKALAPLVSRVTLSVPAALRRPELEIKLDGKEVEPAAWGQAIPADPGLHRVTALLPGSSPWQSTFTFGQKAQQKTVEIGPLTSLPVVEKGSVTEAAKAPTVSAASPVAADAGHSRPGLRAASYVVMSSGAVAVAVGSIFGLRTFAKATERNDNCPLEGGLEHCNGTAVAAYHSGNSSALVADVTFGLGIAALGTGVAMWFLSRSPETAREQPPASVALHASARGAGLTLSRQW